MKTPAFIATAAVGLSLTGCGGAPKVHPAGAPSGAITFTAPTTTTIASPRTGQRMVCDNHGVAPSASVPSRGHGVAGTADGKYASAIINLTRHSDGTLLVSCTP
jgi:hypothetical protein